MNRIYRLVWSDSREAYVPVSEVSRKRGKRAGGRIWRRLVVALLLALPLFAHALPEGGEIRAGSGAIEYGGDLLTVTQGSPKLSIDWHGFDISRGETVTFVQPGSGAIAVNRVVGGSSSAIYGRLSANGQVFLLNPNGVLFGHTARVDVGGLVASTLSLSDADLLAGRYRFSGNGGSVINEGSLTAREGGYIALLGGRVSNRGVIEARLGSVALAAGNRVTLDFAGDRLLSVQVDEGALDALAENHQLIRADGGRVVMTAEAADTLLQSVVNHQGVIEARTVEEHNGTITLMGGMEAGSVRVAGTLDASAPDGGDGGLIETSAARVEVADGARVTTLAAAGGNGTWLIDPDGFTIAASGGDMTGAAVSSALAGGNLSIVSSDGGGSSGDIDVDDTISWSANTLTLSATNDINLYRTLEASGSAGLALEYGQGAVAVGNDALYRVLAPIDIAATGSFSTKLGSDGATVGYTIITTLGAEGSGSGGDLQGMSGNLAGYYALGNDIDATATVGWNGGDGFVPVGDFDAGTPFTGTFEGLGHTVDRLTIDRAGFASVNFLGDGVGLFGSFGGELRHLGVTNVDVTGHDNVGGLVGYNSGTITACHTTGGVSHAGTDEDISRTGGLVGYNNVGTIRGSHSAADVGGTSRVGGLVGENNGTLSGDYATGDVSGTNRIGGLVGNSISGTISDCYAGGGASGDNIVGGLVGRLQAGTLLTSYATGSVSAPSNVGGLVGSSAGTVTNSYWNTETSGQAGSAGGTGLTSAQMQQQASFGGFDFAASWAIYQGHGEPLLRSFLRLLTVTAGGDAKTYDGLAYSGGNGVTYSVPGALLSGGVSYGGSAQGAIGAGGYAITPSGFWSSQQGYLIGYADGTLTVNPAPLTVTANDDAKGYDASAYGGGNGIGYSGFVNGETSAVLGGTLSYGGSAQGAVDAGSYAITPSGLTAANYAISYADGTLSVTPASLTLSTSDVTKTYDGTTSAAGSAVVTAGTLYGSDSLSGGSFAFTDPNAGSGKTVTVSGVTVNDGNSGNNYSVGYADNTGSTINRAPLTVTASDDAKGYDASAYGGGNGVGYSGFVNGETSAVLGGTLSYGGTAQGAVNAGSYAITPSGLTAANYTISFADGTLTVTPASLTLSTSDVTKVYDGTTSAVGSAVVTAGTLYGSDSLSGGSFAFSDPNAGSGKSVTVSGVTVNDGNSGNNYGVGYADNTHSTINPAPLTVTASDDAKGYDATSYSGGNGVGYSGFVNGETSAVLGGTLSYGGDSQGAVNTGSYAITPAGLTAANYTIGFADGTLTVTPAPLTLSTSDVTKTYDGTTSAAGSAVVTAGTLYGSDSLSGGSFAFDDRHAGSGKGVTVSGVTVDDGNSGNNYTVSYAANTGSTITPAPLTLSTSDVTKVYDGTTSAAGSAVVTAGTLYGSDGISGGSFAFSDPNAGSGKSVTVSGVTVDDGNSGNNYTVGYADNTGSTITPAPLTVTANDDATVYDASAYGGGNGVGYSGFVHGETSTVLGGTLSYGGNSQGAVNAGSYAITPSGLTAANYALGYADGTLTINPSLLIITTSDVTKTYDGTTAAVGTIELVDSFLYGSDSLSGGSFTFTDPHVGSGKSVTVSGVTVNDGNSGNNYQVVYFENLNGTITPAPLTLSAGAVTKTYDGTTGASGSVVVSAGTLYGGDTLSGGSFAFSDPNAGTGKGVTLSGVTVDDGNSGNNYTIGYVAGSAGIIEPALLTITAANDAKAYDAGAYRGGNGVAYDGFVNGEDSAVLAGALGYGGNAQGAIDAGSYAITPSGLTATNYAIRFVDGTLTVSPAPLTLSAATLSKRYDGTTGAEGSVTVATGTLYGNDRLSGGSFAFDDPGVGSGKPVTLSGVTVDDGNAGDNYRIRYLAGTTGTIEAAPLAVTANDDLKGYDGRPYRGGNGVAYSGFVNGETRAVLGGSLNYGGTAQGAVGTGSYTIVPSGLTAANYDLTFVAGTLTIEAAAANDGYFTALAAAAAPATTAADDGQEEDEKSAVRAAMGPTVQKLRRSAAVWGGCMAGGGGGRSAARFPAAVLVPPGPDLQAACVHGAGG